MMYHDVALRSDDCPWRCEITKGYMKATHIGVCKPTHSHWSKATNTVAGAPACAPWRDASAPPQRWPCPWFFQKASWFIGQWALSAIHNLLLVPLFNVYIYICIFMQFQLLSSFNASKTSTQQPLYRNAPRGCAALWRCWLRWCTLDGRRLRFSMCRRLDLASSKLFPVHSCPARGVASGCVNMACFHYGLYGL